MEPIRVAVVGLGSISAYHLRAFAKLPDARLEAVVSRNPESVERARREYGIPRGFRSFEESLVDARLDAVVLCTPNDLHYRMAAQALAAGKHVLVEKPLASTLAEAEDLCRRADDARRTVMCAMTARFTPQYLAAFRAIRGGEIGEILQIVIRWFERKTIGVNWEGKRVPVDARTSTVLYHHGSHMLDAALWFADDETAELHAIGGRRQSLNDDVSILIRTRRGCLITSSHSFNASRKSHDVLIVGTRGTIEILGYEKMWRDETLRVSTAWQAGFEEGVVNQDAEFVASLREGRPPIACARELLPSYRALELAFEALAVRGVVDA
ncbi:MAG: Gfo/Idh/MocA family oxidoreductase [Planctomycetota bacterium]